MVRQKYIPHSYKDRYDEVFFDDIHKNISIFVFQGFYSFFLRDILFGRRLLKEWVRRIYSFLENFVIYFHEKCSQLYWTLVDITLRYLAPQSNFSNIRASKCTIFSFLSSFLYRNNYILPWPVSVLLLGQAFLCLGERDFKPFFSNSLLLLQQSCQFCEIFFFSFVVFKFDQMVRIIKSQMNVRRTSDTSLTC